MAASSIGSGMRIGLGAAATSRPFRPVAICRYGRFRDSETGACIGQAECWECGLPLTLEDIQQNGGNIDEYTELEELNGEWLLCERCWCFDNICKYCVVDNGEAYCTGVYEAKTVEVATEPTEPIVADRHFDPATEF
jgi:hypothetical protein